MAGKLDQILVIDIEATCWEGQPPEHEESEIIEIGICPIDVVARARLGSGRLSSIFSFPPSDAPRCTSMARARKIFCPGEIFSPGVSSFTSAKERTRSTVVTFARPVRTLERCSPSSPH